MGTQAVPCLPSLTQSLHPSNASRVLPVPFSSCCFVLSRTTCEARAGKWVSSGCPWLLCTDTYPATHSWSDSPTAYRARGPADTQHRPSTAHGRGSCSSPGKRVNIGSHVSVRPPGFSPATVITKTQFKRSSYLASASRTKNRKHLT